MRDRRSFLAGTAALAAVPAVAASAAARESTRIEAMGITTRAEALRIAARLPDSIRHSQARVDESFRSAMAQCQVLREAFDQLDAQARALVERSAIPF